MENGEKKVCSVCGRELVNDYERGTGVCILCERENAEIERADRNLSREIAWRKYAGRLKFFKVLSYVMAVLTALLSLSAAQTIDAAVAVVLAICGAVLWCGIGTIFGALGEILNRL